MNTSGSPEPEATTLRFRVQKPCDRRVELGKGLEAGVHLYSYSDLSTTTTTTEMKRYPHVLESPRLLKRFIGLFGLVCFVLLFFVPYFQILRQPVQLESDVQKPQDQDPNSDRVVVPAGEVHIPTMTKLSITEDKEKKLAVVEAFKYAWAAYERDAMGYDEYHPLTQKGTNFSRDGGIGYMIIDALDTIQLMELEEEYKRSRQWIAESLSFDRDENFNLFETTIRVLGGLLSAYHLSHNDTLFRDRAVDLADRLLPAFNTSSGIPQAMSNLGKRVGVYDFGNGGLVSTAEVTTLQLEFRYLSHITGDYKYWDKVENVMKIIGNLTMPMGGLAPIFMRPQEGTFTSSDIRLGSRGDSFYEYLLKQYIQTNQTEPVYRKMYDETMEAVHNHLIKRSLTKGLAYTVELLPNRGRGENSWKELPKQDHLVCFLGGSLMLGTRFGGSGNVNARDWKIGQDLIDGCMATHDTETGLSPEIVYWRVEDDGHDGEYPDNDWYIKGSYSRSGSRNRVTTYDARYILRPETVESLFLAYRLTGDEKYRNWGWGIFQSIEKHCRLDSGGYASILNVDDKKTRKDNKMETFFLAETLKYLYLLFSNASVVPLNEYVFNTEAHPLPIFTPSRRWVER